MSILKSAEVSRADWLLAVTGQDEVNLTACELAETLGAKRVLARLNDPRNRATFDALGIPVVAVTDLISQLISREIDFLHLERIALLARGRISLIEAEVGPEDPGPAGGRPGPARPYGPGGGHPGGGGGRGGHPPGRHGHRAGRPGAGGDHGGAGNRGACRPEPRAAGRGRWPLTPGGAGARSRRVLGGVLGLIVEALVVGLSILAALAVAALALWVA